MIKFTKPATTRNERIFLEEALSHSRPWGGGHFYNQALETLSGILGAQKVLLTQSGTSALELAALAIGVKPGDEVIMPSYTFTSTANAFVLRGARIVFVDANPETLNIEVSEIESKVTEKTRALVVVHYGGTPVQMDQIKRLAEKHNLLIIEDAAQAIGSRFEGAPVGTLGDIGCFSFHGTKNISSGEGGAIVVNSKDDRVWFNALLAHEKGTNRFEFIEGKVDKYSWKSLGISAIPSEFTCAVLASQLMELQDITLRRIDYWKQYHDRISCLPDGFRILGSNKNGFNGHLFALMTPTSQIRQQIISFLRSRGIEAVSHYVPLHNSPFSFELNQTNKVENLPVTESLSRVILRLPMWSAPEMPVSLVVESLLDAINEVGSE